MVQADVSALNIEPVLCIIQKGLLEMFWLLHESQIKANVKGNQMNGHQHTFHLVAGANIVKQLS
jgi:hypothetical protein